MCCGDLPQKQALVASQRIESHPAVVSHYHQIAVVVSEHELLDLLLDLDLMRQDEGLRVVDVHAVAIVTHDGETALHSRL